MLTALWLVPALAGLVLVVLPIGRSAAAGLGLLGSALTATIALVAVVRFDVGAGVQFSARHTWVSDIGIGYHVGADGLSLVLVALTAFVMPWTILFAIRAGRERLHVFLGLCLLLEAALLLLFMARDLALFYVGFEAMLIPLAFLIGAWGGSGRTAATLTFIIYTLVGSLLMLVSIIVLGLRAGSFDLDRVGTSGSIPLFLAFMAAFAIKAPLYPFHGWVPAAYRESTAEVAAVLSGVVSKAGTYGMLRFALPLFPGPAATLRVPLIVLSLAGLLWCSLVAFRQPDSRGVIAYSSIAQMSLISLGIFVLDDPGATGAAFQMVNHGLLSALLFLLAGLCELRFGSSLFGRIGALARGRAALATVCMITGVAALAVPGSSLFASEFLVLLGAFRRHWLIGAAASTAIVLGAMYMLRWISAILHDPPAEAEAIGSRTASSASAERVAARVVPGDLRLDGLVLVPLVAAVLALSVYPASVTRRVEGAVHALTAPAAARIGP